MAKLEEWQDYAAGTFAAFCRKMGHWKPPKKSKTNPDEKRKLLNWNNEIQDTFSTKIKAAFNLLDGDIDTVKTETTKDIGSLYQTLQDRLNGMLSIPLSHYLMLHR